MSLPTSTVQEKSLKNTALSCLPRSFLEKANAETEYETIPAEEVTEKDTVVENIVEEAKHEEKENENGDKGTW